MPVITYKPIATADICQESGCSNTAVVEVRTSRNETAKTHRCKDHSPSWVFGTPDGESGVMSDADQIKARSVSASLHAPSE